MTHPVTEFAILRLKSDITFDDLDIRRVSVEQSAWSGFPLYWFTYTTGQDTFACILSQWASVPAHQAWIASPQNQALLQLMLPKLEIAAFCHVDLHTSRSEIQLNDIPCSAVELEKTRSRRPGCEKPGRSEGRCMRMGGGRLGADILCVSY